LDGVALGELTHPHRLKALRPSTAGARLAASLLRTLQRLVAAILMPRTLGVSMRAMRPVGVCSVFCTARSIVVALLADVGSGRVLAMARRFAATLFAGVRVARPRFVTGPAFPIAWTRILFSLGTLRVLAMARRFAATLFASVRVMRARLATMLVLAASTMRMLFALGARRTPVAM
jgi:hypothetical protein